MSDGAILLETDARGVTTLTLNRPEKHNAFDETVIAALTRAFQAVGADPDARVLVIRANGRNFCAGADLEWMKRTATYTREQNVHDAGAMARMLHALNFLPVPSIARVQGAALGGGTGLACCCDMVVAADNASFAFSEVRLGLIPATISPYAIAAVGLRAARRYFLTAERFDARRASALGLVSEVVAEAELDMAVEKLTSTLLSNSPAAIRAAKKLMFEVSGRAVDSALIRLTSEGIADARASAEGREGVTAFLEKRAPEWP